MAKECPFNLPAECEKGAPKIRYFVLSADRKLIATCEYEDDALFIQNAVNCHEKLMDIKIWAYEVACTGDQQASDKLIGLIEEFDKALAEAEKENGQTS